MFTDFNEHIKDIVLIQSKQNNYLPNFLFYFLVNALSFFSAKTTLIQFSTIFIMGLSVVAKYIISKNFIKEFSLTHEGKRKERFIVISIAFMLLVCFSIPDAYNYFTLKKLYLGRLVPVVWHNSTTIMVFPFAILLFWKQIKLFDNIIYNKKDVLIINILVILNALIKPSFLFVYLPITFLLLVLKIKQLNKQVLLAMSPIITGVLLILIQYFLIYLFELGSFYSQSSSITFVSPFKIYSNFVPYWYIPIAFILSLALPIFTVVLYREILKFKPFVFSSLLLILGIIISAFLSETGPRQLHGNFFWQNVLCTYLVFLTTITFLLNKFLRNDKRISNKFLFIVFLAHFFSGIIYIVKIFSTHLYD